MATALSPTACNKPWAAYILNILKQDISLDYARLKKRDSPLGPIEVRTGLSFYPGGQFKTLEPARPTPVQTPLGTLYAYNCQAPGLNGDANSLCFSAAGTLISLMTSTDEIELTGKNGEKYLFRPGLKTVLQVGCSGCSSCTGCGERL
ncbi:hypothetical protein [Desulfoscipio geothermicus]|nr:hypothetical protein [Desulfoscipio geothermicus]